MGKVVIRVEQVYKQYRLGLVSTGTLAHDLNRLMHRLAGKDDPYEKVTSANQRWEKAETDYVWALQDVNFDVHEGQVLGIIGRNGAGKSTLLKILSKVTGPTKGHIKVKGRIASLLEVGTGFHPELTGRENVFLNGAILGMTKSEIKSKFDEIVDFSGVERYIDTPVKRYSSGMYVRLAFAVAAHLEPEILIVDEVLAVGDAEFQKKCLGKMKDVSVQGRTVLFVSHNMAAIETLCGRAILMEQGKLTKEGTSSEIVEYYLRSGSFGRRRFSHNDPAEAPGSEEIRVLWGAVENASADNTDATIDVTNEIDIKFGLINLTDSEILYAGFDLKSGKGDIIMGSGQKFASPKGQPVVVSCKVPGNFLNDGYYIIHAYFHTEGMRKLYSDEELLTFEIKDTLRESGYLGRVNGLIRPVLQWSTMLSS